MLLKTDYQSVYTAWQNFRKGKKPSRVIDAFTYSVEENIRQLSKQLNDQSYSHGPYQAVILHEKKRRDLAVAAVRDRIVHRLLYDYLVPCFDKRFDPDAWSCRKNKGLHACLGRTQNLLRRYGHSYVWRADVTKFFDSVVHDMLLRHLQQVIGRDRQAMWICAEVIASYAMPSKKPQASTKSYKRGVPIGNLTSQIFANIYLNEFDRFVRHTLKPQAYVRYGDDFALFATTRRQIYQFRQLAQEFLRRELGLGINPKNDIVVTAQKGLKFLGHTVTNDTVVVDKHTTAKALSKIDWHNVSSYKALRLNKTAKNTLDWILLEKYVDIL